MAWPKARRSSPARRQRGVVRRPVGAAGLRGSERGAVRTPRGLASWTHRCCREMSVLLEVRGLVREFPAGEGAVAVLRDVDLTIESGEMVAIMGPSGSGKSTLMNILGCLDRPTRGSYRVAGQE